VENLFEAVLNMHTTFSITLSLVFYKPKINSIDKEVIMEKKNGRANARFVPGILTYARGFNTD
jgi:hypothetical protein